MNLMEEGRKAFESGDADKALQCYQREVQETSSLDARAKVAMVLAYKGMAEEAQKEVTEILAVDPGCSNALLVLGLLKAGSNQTTEAAEFFQRALSSNPANLEAGLNLAVVHRQLGRTEESIEALRNVLERNTGSSEAHYQLAQSLLASEQVEESVAEFQTAIQLDPTKHRYWLDLGEITFIAGDVDRAEKLYRKALQLVKQPVFIQRRLVQHFLRQDRLRDALSVLQTLATATNDVDDWMQLGNLAILAGESALALDAFQKAVEANSSAWQPHFNLAELYASINKLESSESEYRNSIHLGSGAVEPHSGYGLWLLGQQRMDEALVHLVMAHSLSPQSPLIAYNLSLAYARTGKKLEASQLLDQVLTSPAEEELHLSAKKLQTLLSASSTGS